jgi:DeoR family fructose operon transcriptional repressor
MIKKCSKLSRLYRTIMITLDHLNQYDPKMSEIYTYIQSTGRASVAELSKKLATSESTIRRNLRKLAEMKLIKRFHGGAAASTSVFKEPPVSKRSTMNRDEKRAIGKEAADLVEDGDTIILRSGTTVAEMIPHLLEKRNLKIITNMLAPPPALIQSPHKVILTGGEIDKDELCTTGLLAATSMKNLRAEKLFTGALGIDPNHGIMADDFNEVSVTRSFIDASDQVIVLADHTKFNQVAPMILCSVDEIDCILTDGDTPENIILYFRELDIEVISCGGTNGN